MPAPGRQLILDRLERLGETRDVAVPEYPEGAGKQRNIRAVYHCPLGGEPFHDSLRHRQSDRFHRCLPVVAVSRASDCPRLPIVQTPMT